MPYPRCVCLFVVLGIVLSLAVQAQESAAHPKAAPPVDNDFVQKQFGSTCTLMPGPTPLTADLDDDGIEDVVIVARCSNPLMDETENNYKVVDPYNAFFGYGDPKITSQFASEDPQSRGLSKGKVRFRPCSGTARSTSIGRSAPAWSNESHRTVLPKNPALGCWVTPTSASRHTPPPPNSI